MDCTDGELVDRARAGEKSAFGRLIERHQARAVRVARAMVGNEAVAQKLAQEALLQAYLSLDRLQDDSHLASWLHGIVRNVCRSHLREEQRKSFALVDLEDDLAVAAPPSADPGAIAEQREQARLIREAVEMLSPPNREATRLFYFEQLSLQEVAAALGVSVGAVKTRRHQSQKQLRERLLPLYPEMRPDMLKTRRSRKMVKVTLAPHVLDGHPHDREDPGATDEATRRFLIKVLMSHAPANPGEWVGLMEQGGSRFLPLHVDRLAAATVRAPHRTAPEGTPALALLIDLLQTAGITLAEVRIAPLGDAILHATVKIRQNGAARAIEARPADGLVLAVQAGLPLLVAEETMQREAWDLSDARAIAGRLLRMAGEAALREAAENPFPARVADGILEGLRRRLPAGDSESKASVFIGHRPLGIPVRLLEDPDAPVRPDVYMAFHYAGNIGGGNVAMPYAVFLLLLARFKGMAGLDPMEHVEPQQGETTVRLQGSEYRLWVASAPTPPDESLRLRLTATGQAIAPAVAESATGPEPLAREGAVG